MKLLPVLAFLCIASCNLEDSAENNGPEPPSDICREYCDDSVENCKGELQIYANQSECFEACKTFPDDPSQPVETALVGDTIQCRLYHLRSAEVDPETHCIHSSADSLPGKCVDEITACDRYCGIIVENCPAQFANINLCLGACGTIPKDGIPNEELGDTVQCRITYANRAVGDKTNCENASVSMSPACIER